MREKPGLRPDEAVGDTLRAIARHIVEGARVAIEDRQRVEAVAVHDFRAGMKFWRAYLRLIEPFLPEDDLLWRTEARDLARMLATARDAQASLDALADAEGHAASHRLSSQSWETIRDRLEVLRSKAEIASLTPALRKRISASLDRAEGRIEQWPLDGLTFSDVVNSLSDGYRRARQLMPDDWRSATAQDLHEFRRRVIIHRYQMEVVEPLWPRLSWAWIKEAQRLRTRLGRHQDLTVLAGHTEPHQPLAHWRSRLQSVIAQRQAQHAAASRQLAARLFAERPKAFRRRMEAMWNRGAAG
jgi:CHAD domain-containing protein